MLQLLTSCNLAWVLRAVRVWPKQAYTYKAPAARTRPWCLDLHSRLGRWRMSRRKNGNYKWEKLTTTKDFSCAKGSERCQPLRQTLSWLWLGFERNMVERNQIKFVLIEFESLNEFIIHDFNSAFRAKLNFVCRGKSSSDSMPKDKYKTFFSNRHTNFSEKKRSHETFYAWKYKICFPGDKNSSQNRWMIILNVIAWFVLHHLPMPSPSLIKRESLNVCDKRLSNLFPNPHKNVNRDPLFDAHMEGLS